MSNENKKDGRSTSRRSRVTTSRGVPVVSRKSEERLMDHQRWDEIAVYRNYLYITKLVAGVALGIVTAILYYNGYQNPTSFASQSGLLWFGILVLGLVISFIAMRYGFKVTEEDMSTRDILLKATFTYIVAFIATAAMIWMFLMGSELQPLIDHVLNERGIDTSFSVVLRFLG